MFEGVLVGLVAGVSLWRFRASYQRRVYARPRAPARACVCVCVRVCARACVCAFYAGIPGNRRRVAP